jgi:dipeptidyl aminopeptidase/acylaminoacyl peptidase
VFDFTSSRRTSIRLGEDVSDGFSWSPDGRELVAVDQDGTLVVVDASGAILKFLPAPVKRSSSSPAWSPDGRKIAFLADDDKIELMPASGGRPRVVARHADGGATWSPDGHRLLYTSFTRDPVSYSVRVLNLATRRNTQIEGGRGLPRWSPDGSAVAFELNPFGFGTDGDLWTAHASGGDLRQLTEEFPTGISYADFDWAPGSVPAVKPSPPPALLPLTPTGELKLGYYDSISRAAAPDSVVVNADDLCDPEAETTETTFTTWTPSTGQTTATTTDCQDWTPYGAVTPTLAAWAAQYNLNGNTILEATRIGSTDTYSASWVSGQEAPDIGWRDGIGAVVSDGSTLFFTTYNNDGTFQLWRIADSGTELHAVPVPVPADATDLFGVDAGRIVVRTGKTSLAALGPDGAVVSRIPVPARASAVLGAGLLAVAAHTTLSVYDTGNGNLAYQLPLAGASGTPQLLTIGSKYAVYASGIELHLLRLDNGTDRIIDLPGQDGQLEALLTADGLFIAYYQGYDQQPGRVMFIQEANLP